MVKGYIFDIMRFSPKDGEGIRSVVFFKGCPLSCKWCHNPEGYMPVTNYADGSPIAKVMTARQVVDVLLKDKIYYQLSNGGVTLSGGEATAQPEFAKSLIRECKKEGLHVIIETCGMCQPDVFKEIVDICDEVYFDFKLWNKEEFFAFTKGDIDVVKENFSYLCKSCKKTVLRCPLIGGVNLNKSHLDDIISVVNSSNAVKKIELLPYNDLLTDKYKKVNIDYKEEYTVPSKEQMLKSLNYIQKNTKVEVICL